MNDSRSGKDWHHFRLLVVDDDPDMRMLIEAVVNGVWPHAQVMTFDPLDESATKIFDWSRFDMLILDYQLGNQSGLDWLRQYRGVPDFPLTIFITGAGSEEVAVKALKLGAVDYVRKGEGFQGRLVSAINDAILEMSERISEQSDWARFLDYVEKELGGKQASGAMFYVVLDQFTAIKATKGVQIAGHILSVLSQLVRDELGAAGVRVRTELHGENAVVALGSGLDQVGGIELQARRILEQVRKVRFRAGDSEVVTTASVGVCMADAGTREAARLVARAEAACHSAMLRGGNQSYLGTLQGEIGEAVSSDQGIGKVWRDDLDVNALLKSRRLRALFHDVRCVQHTPDMRYLRAAPTLFRDDGSVMDDAEMLRFQSAPGRRTFLDRVTISQALHKLKAECQSEPCTVFLRVSGESVAMPRFWTWLIGRLDEVPSGSRLVFELSVHDRQSGKLPVEAILRVNAMPGCDFALHGLLPDMNLAELIDGLPVGYHVVDMVDQVARLHCDRIVQLVAEAGARQLKVLLTGINSTETFGCAYRASASLLEGSMASEWEEMELNDGPADAAGWTRN
ncbi:MAG: response regulator [Gammaproteobacteria bacterium]|nr:response regulator [Gammaproteobacteria bacterium]